MNTIDVGCMLNYQVNATSNFLFQIAAVQNERQHLISESMNIQPQSPLEACQIGPLGNRMYRLIAEPGILTVNYTARCTLNRLSRDPQQLSETRHHNLPPDVLTYLYPSRYCESDKLARFAWEEFQYIEPGYKRVRHIVDWVNNYLSYEPGTTGPTSTACDVLLSRTGVCRDYAHLCIALCRALGIPARYVAGYAVKLQPPDFHGYFEAYLGNAWFLFDATRLAPVTGFVRIGTGRDAADVSFATIVGAALSINMNVWAYPADENEDQSDNDTTDEQAISTAS